MSDDQQGTPRPDDETQPVRPGGEAAPLPGPPGAAATPPAETYAETNAEAHQPAPTARRGFRDRLRSLRRTDGRDRTYGLAALVASALAGVIVGGLGLTALDAITHDGPGDRFDRFDRAGWVQQREDRGPGGGFDGRGGIHGGMRGGPPGLPGQVQPTTPPDDDEGFNS